MRSLPHTPDEEKDVEQVVPFHTKADQRSAYLCSLYSANFAPVFNCATSLMNTLFGSTNVKILPVILAESIEIVCYVNSFISQKSEVSHSSGFCKDFSLSPLQSETTMGFGHLQGSTQQRIPFRRPS